MIPIVILKVSDRVTEDMVEAGFVVKIGAMMLTTRRLSTIIIMNKIPRLTVAAHIHSPLLLLFHKLLNLLLQVPQFRLGILNLEP